MENQLIISFKGRNGKIELYENFVRLDRGTVMGFLMQGLKGQKDIYFNSISSIQIKKPGLTVGYIQFSLPGGNESKRGVFDSNKEENTISFGNHDGYEKALKIKEFIENKKQSQSPGASTAAISVADELGKMHALVEKGILTKDEFEREKNKLLNK